MTVSPEGPGRWRRHRTTLLLAVGFLLAVGVALWTAGPPETTADLDPDNPNPDGARALARVLGAEGVDVRVTRDLTQLEGTGLPPGSTLVVTSPQFLSKAVVDRVRSHADGSRIVVVGPSQGVLDALSLDLDTVAAEQGSDDYPARCRDRLMAGLTLTTDRASAFAAPGCFPAASDRHLVVERGKVTLVGAPFALSNDEILRGDNAAFALRLLGQSDRLDWYVPAATDAAPGEGVGLTDLLPRFVLPGLLLLTITMVAVVLWRGRRLGPLAVEPLPVSVKAVETTLSRGRLYRRAGDRDHAAARLRSATRRRLAERLHGQARPPEETLVRDLAHQLGRSEAELARVLRSDAPGPGDDRDLIRLAEALAELEEEVRQR